MNRDQKIHDLAIAAAAVATYYNKGEIDDLEKTDRLDFICSDVTFRYESCYKIIEKLITD